MRAALHTVAIAALLAMAQAKGQTPYPDLTLQDLTWTDGTHHIGVTQKILSPSTPDLPVAISGTADAEFVSGTQVRLRPGFHAGGFALNEGQFHAYIGEALGPVGDVIIISPDVNGNDPYGGIADNVIHVHKWEKVEVGLRLPQEYQDAIDRFFASYYTNGVTNDATPGNVDAVHDLNPYADDSLQLVMTLTRPDGSQLIKWGYFAREAKWFLPNNESVWLINDAAHPLNHYVRFRFSPDQGGTWNIALSAKAPHTRTEGNLQLDELLYTGFVLNCTSRLPDNKGPLSVNQNNGRMLWHAETGEHFFGLGTNLADKSGGLTNNPSTYRLLRRDFDFFKEVMDDLHDVGGNFVRMWLMRNLFQPEWRNLGVYDAYTTDSPCENAPVEFTVNGNGQFNSWAFDRMVEHARTKGIYIQLCIDPNLPIINYERFHWGFNPYFVNYVERHPETNALNRLDMERFFYSYPDNDPENEPYRDQGALYFWKRKYKYIMSRWGYSVNVPIIEPFNEIDQMPSYRYSDLTGGNNSNCPENLVVWNEDTGLPGTYDAWLSDIISYVKDPAVPSNPVESPLGESGKLFISGTGQSSGSNPDWNKPNENPHLDLTDVHEGLYNGSGELERGFDQSQLHRNAHATQQGGNAVKRPFRQGEFQWYASVDHDFNPATDAFPTESVFDNYDVSFHNELWASTFFGNFTAGTTWHWPRVFWWERGLHDHAADPLNAYQQGAFSQVLGAPNALDVNGNRVDVVNRKLHHHFRPIANMLANPDWQAYGFFDDEFVAKKQIDPTHRLECFYLQNTIGSLAIGWVHNREAHWENAFYVTSLVQNYAGCPAPYLNALVLDGFLPEHDYYITWFPTRLNTTEGDLPEEDVWNSGVTTSVLLDFSSTPLGGVLNHHLDTLHSDYAFIISTGPIEKGRRIDELVAPSQAPDWGFIAYPNPATDELNLRFEVDAVRDIDLFDVLGKRLKNWNNVGGVEARLALEGLSKGFYTLRVSSAEGYNSKTLIIQ
ncbi:MAG: T9SS type A sorting domain-containing protein [Flavobacteriales bacterium]|nr:T9SS type A sorting domain-containing protein [Flavobacteriales bacterium]